MNSILVIQTAFEHVINDVQNNFACCLSNFLALGQKQLENTLSVLVSCLSAIFEEFLDENHNVFVPSNLLLILHQLAYQEICQIVCQF